MVLETVAACLSAVREGSNCPIAAMCSAVPRGRSQVAFCHGPIDRSSTDAARSYSFPRHLPWPPGDRLCHQHCVGQWRHPALSGAAGARRRPHGRRGANRARHGRVHRAGDRAGAAVRHHGRPAWAARAAGLRPRAVRSRGRRSGGGAVVPVGADPARHPGHRRERAVAADDRADQRHPAGRPRSAGRASKSRSTAWR